MPTLSTREKRTVRLGVAVLLIYFAAFLGLRAGKKLEKMRGDYHRLLVDAQRLQRDLRPYETRVLLAEKLKADFHLDPAKLTRASLVAKASAAIQNAARTGGVELGPIRESPAHSSARELTSMQLEGIGTVSAVMGLLQQLESTGFPLVVDSIQINPGPQPGKLKVSLTIVILDFEQWKEELPRA
jgi:hypothetical protein